VGFGRRPHPNVERIYRHGTRGQPLARRIRNLVGTGPDRMDVARSNDSATRIREGVQFQPLQNSSCTPVDGDSRCSGTVNGSRVFTTKGTDIPSGQRSHARIKAGPSSRNASKAASISLELPIAYDGLNDRREPENDWSNQLTHRTASKNMFVARQPAKKMERRDRVGLRRNIPNPSTPDGLGQTYDYLPTKCSRKSDDQETPAVTCAREIRTPTRARPRRCGQKFSIVSSAPYFTRKQRTNCVPCVREPRRLDRVRAERGEHLVDKYGPLQSTAFGFSTSTPNRSTGPSCPGVRRVLSAKRSDVL